MPDTPDLSAALADARQATRQLARAADAGALPEETAAVLDELQRLLARLGDAAAPAAAADAPAATPLFFDVSDLLGYFPYNRLPTGVQRVQISIILNLLDEPGRWRIAPCRYLDRINEWREVPVAAFRSLCAMSLADGDTEAADWRAEYARLDNATLALPPLRFPDGACLVNLGTSWWLPDYFAAIRQAKAVSGIRYVPLVHDLIPATMPEYCNIELVHEFVDWVVGVLQHADFFLAVSDSTKRDLLALAARLGADLPAARVAVVPLASELNHVAASEAWRGVALGRWGLRPDRFVLFVSTVEARKNQLAAFDAWQALLNTHSRDQVPTLVCVGKRGYQAHEALARLETNPDLRSHVLLLDNVDDAGLEALYRQCAFTIYPSLYEGWGLPVTESLAYGKVPVIADNSSLPQAGGGHAVLFATGSQAQFVAALERMLFEDGYRRDREAAIAAQFRVRTWREVARDLERAVAGVADGTADLRRPWRVPFARPGYYPLLRNREAGIRPGVGSAEVFRKGGSGWWRMEDFGAWTRPQGGELLMRLDPAVRQVAVRLEGHGDQALHYLVDADTGGRLAEGLLARRTTRWLVLDLPATPRPDDLLTLHITSRETQTVVDPKTKHKREIGVGVGGFFVLDPASPRARLDFVEAVALGALEPVKVDPLHL